MNTLYSSPKAIDQQLEQLYLRRIAVDSLIRIIEDYHKAFEQPQNLVLKGTLPVNHGSHAIA